MVFGLSSSNLGISISFFLDINLLSIISLSKCFNKSFINSGLFCDSLIYPFNFLDNIKGYFLLSYNDTPYIRKIYKNYHISSFKNHQGLTGAGGSDKVVTDLLINIKLLITVLGLARLLFFFSLNRKKN